MCFMVRTTQYPLGHDVISQLPASIKLINIQAGSTDNIDLATANQHNILVSIAPVSDYARPEVAEHVFALIFAATKRLLENDSNVRNGKWRNPPVSDSLLTITGKTLGVIGFGAVGNAVAKMGKLLGLKPVVHTRQNPENPHDGIIFTDLETAVSHSDILVLCVSLNNTSLNLINRDIIERIKPGTIVVNIARGLVVDEKSMAAAADKRDLFYCADVFSKQPVTADHPLVKKHSTNSTYCLEYQGDNAQSV